MHSALASWETVLELCISWLLIKRILSWERENVSPLTQYSSLPSNTLVMPVKRNMIPRSMGVVLRIHGYRKIIRKEMHIFPHVFLIHGDHKVDIADIAFRKRNRHLYHLSYLLSAFLFVRLYHIFLLIILNLYKFDKNRLDIDRIAEGIFDILVSQKKRI